MYFSYYISSGSACSSLCDGNEALVCSAVIYSCSSEMFSILQLNYLFLKTLSVYFFKQTHFYLKEMAQRGKCRDRILSVQIYMMKIFSIILFLGPLIETKWGPKKTETFLEHNCDDRI